MTCERIAQKMRPDKTLYAITEKGLAIVKRWIVSDNQPDTYRIPMMVRLNHFAPQSEQEIETFFRMATVAATHDHTAALKAMSRAGEGSVLYYSMRLMARLAETMMHGLDELRPMFKPQAVPRVKTEVASKKKTSPPTTVAKAASNGKVTGGKAQSKPAARKKVVLPKDAQGKKTGRAALPELVPAGFADDENAGYDPPEEAHDISHDEEFSQEPAGSDATDMIPA